MTTVSSSTNAFYDRSRSQLASLTAENQKLQSQVDTGNRLSKSSDDPVAASRLRKLAREDTLSTADKSNAERANTDLSTADSTLSDVATQVTRAKALATQAANGTLSDDDRKAIATELGSIYSDLVSLANTKDSGGHALFGGQASGDAYTLDASGNAVYAGTSTSDEVSLGQGQSVTRSVTGAQAFGFTDASGNSTDILATVKKLADALSTGDATTAQSAASEAMTNLDTGLSTVSTAQTVVGTRLSWIELTNDRRTTSGDTRTSEETNVGQVDLTTTITQLQQSMTVLEAAQSAFTKLSSLSLFSQL